jgi:hypothetical protein
MKAFTYHFLSVFSCFAASRTPFLADYLQRLLNNTPFTIRWPSAIELVGNSFISDWIFTVWKIFFHELSKMGNGSKNSFEMAFFELRSQSHILPDKLNLAHIFQHSCIKWNIFIQTRATKQLKDLQKLVK